MVGAGPAGLAAAAILKEAGVGAVVLEQSSGVGASWRAHYDRLDESGRPAVHGANTHPGAPGLYFVGFSNPISGNLREDGIQARKIARAAASTAQLSP